MSIENELCQNHGTLSSCLDEEKQSIDCNLYFHWGDEKISLRNLLECLHAINPMLFDKHIKEMQSKSDEVIV